MGEDLYITCVVISYNSSKTILETLDSIVNQDYAQLDLVIADDCSNDGTQSLVNTWVELNSARFRGVTLVMNDKNLGISGNLNSGLSHVKTEWVKTLAADDKLRRNAIARFVQEISVYPFVQFFYSDISPFTNCDSLDDIGLVEFQNKARAISKLVQDAEQQHSYLKKENFIFTPSIFFKLNCVLEVGGFDEQIPLMEDWPLYLRLTSLGIKLQFIEEILVEYSVSSTSVQKSDKYLQSYYLFELKYFWPCLPHSVIGFIRTNICFNCLKLLYVLLKLVRRLVHD